MKKKIFIGVIGVLFGAFLVISIIFNLRLEIKNAAKINLNKSGWDVDITDDETIQHITDSINNMIFVPSGISIGTGGRSYSITWYDEAGNKIESMTFLSGGTISEDVFFYNSIFGGFDTKYLDELIKNYRIDAGDHLNSVEGKAVLSQTELEWFGTKFFNNDENRITNMFLTSTYSDVRNVDLEKLFYCGADGYAFATVSEEEKHLLAQEDDYAQESVYELDVVKTTSDEMEEVLKKYTGFCLAELDQVNLFNLYFLDEYKAYYNIAGDTIMTKYAFEKGWKMDDGSIILQYTDALNGDVTQKYIVTLKLVNEDYHFITNAILIEDN